MGNNYDKVANKTVHRRSSLRCDLFQRTFSALCHEYRTDATIVRKLKVKGQAPRESWWMIATLSSNRSSNGHWFLWWLQCRSKDEEYPVITCMHKKQGKETTRRHFSVGFVGRTSSYTYNERVALKHTYIAEPSTHTV